MHVIANYNCGYTKQSSKYWVCPIKTGLKERPGAGARKQNGLRWSAEAVKRYVTFLIYRGFLRAVPAEISADRQHEFLHNLYREQLLSHQP